ncbi:MAG: hypothetical protein IT431_12625 [Phycisphaerales bacterium]|nr:hypothetical protein [Phycisphaerales bacterium]
MQCARNTLVPLASLALAVPAVLADDLTPPSWRGDAGTTFQHWGFDQPGGGPPDAGFNNPYGMPLFAPSNGATWDPIDPSGQRTGTYMITFDQTLNFEIPNHGQHGAQKELWLQYVYTTIDGIGPTSSVMDYSNGSNFTLISSSPTDLGGGLYHQLDIYSYADCPPGELVTLSPGTLMSPAWIDQVVIDTRCIPAPATLGLIGAAGLIGARRRRS